MLHEATHTCEDGLVDPQGGGADFDDPDVCWHLVTNCKDKSRAGGTGSTQHPGNGDSKPQTETKHMQVHRSTQPGAMSGPAPGKGPALGYLIFSAFKALLNLNFVCL